MSFTDLFARLRRADPAPPVLVGPPAQACATKALPKFLTALRSREQPVLLDLGSVVGSNVTFFGGELGCKIYVEDLASDIDRHVREDRTADLPEFLSTRLPQPAESVDGIICWDLFDYLERGSAQALAAALASRLRPDGVLLAFFHHQQSPDGVPTYTRHVILDGRTLEHRPYAAARGKGRPLPNRDIARMFEPLAITDQFLLKSHMREVVFRKAAG